MVRPLSILYGESRLLVSWRVGGMCDMADNDEDHSRSRRPGVEYQRWSDTCWELSGWLIER
jgi:hypothetical protein